MVKLELDWRILATLIMRSKVRRRRRVKTETAGRTRKGKKERGREKE